MGSVKVWATMVGCLVVAAAGLAYAITVAADQPPRDGDMVRFDVEAGASAPSVSFMDAAGNPVNWQDFDGRVLLVNFWATWCAPCVHEMPSLDRLQQQLGGQDFEVVAISIDRGGVDQIRSFYRTHGLSDLAIYSDPSGRVPAAFESPGLPTSVLIDRDGSWIGTYVGPADWASDDAVALIRHFLDPAA